MAQQYLLSIDQGTTGTTVSLINTKGQFKAKINQEFRQIFPKPGWVEHNPSDIWRSTVSTIKGVVEKARIKPESIAGIGITNQRETVMAWDRQTGQALGNAIVWQCRRTTAFCESLKKKGVEGQVKETTGLVLDPYFSGTKMSWILQNVPGAKALAKKGQLCFGTVDAFLLWKLSGGEIHATDVSNASRTQLMELATLNYSPEMLKIFGLKEEMLPRIQSSGGVFGFTTKVAGLPAGIPISGVLGDQQSALFGQLCFNSGEAKITYGTGSFLLMNTKTKIVKSSSGLLTTVAWQLPNQNRADYALEGGAFICGAAVQWLRDNLKIIKSSSDIEKLARSTSSADGVQFVPSFVGLGAPFWNPRVQGTFFGITRGTESKHIAYSTLEAMSLQNVDVVNAMAKDARLKVKKVSVDGGASANNLLMQMQADFLGAQVSRPKLVETTSLGAAYMAGLGIGFWSDVSDLKKLKKIDKEFESKISVKERRSRMAYWHKAISSMETYYNSL